MFGWAGVRCFHRGLVDNRFCKTVIRHRTFTWFLQLHFFSSLVIISSLDLLCPSMICLKFAHAAVANLDGISVKYLV